MVEPKDYPADRRMTTFILELWGEVRAGNNFDGGEIQEMLERHGLLRARTFEERFRCWNDPDGCSCRSAGHELEGTCYTPIDQLRPYDEPVT